MGLVSSQEETRKVHEPHTDNVDDSLIAIMNGFFRDPTPENYNTVFEFLTNRDKKPETHLWMLSARKFHGVGEPLTEKEEKFFSEKEALLLAETTVLNPQYLDCLWGLFSTTGDTKYSDRVKYAREDPRVDPITQGAAKWSYGSFVKQGFLNE